MYLKEMGNLPPLSLEKEIELTRRIRKGESAAFDNLIKANLRFVINVAKQYQGKGLPMEDLISEGNLGLMMAAQRFDETRGFKFISYAVWWIKQSILQAIAEQTRVVRLPMNRVAGINNVGHARERCHKKHGREPSLQELADELEVGVSDLDVILTSAPYHLSFDEPFKPDEDQGLIHVYEDYDDLPDDALMQGSLKEEIDLVLAKLKTPREAEIIRLYFGIECDRPLTLEEIGEKFKLTRERVRQIKKEALGRIRQFLSEPLRQYL